MELLNSEAVYLSNPDLQQRYSVCREAINHWIKKPDFPKPYQLSAGVFRWKLAELKEWEKKCQGESA